MNDVKIRAAIYDSDGEKGVVYTDGTRGMWADLSLAIQGEILKQVPDFNRARPGSVFILDTPVSTMGDGNRYGEDGSQYDGDDQGSDDGDGDGAEGDRGDQGGQGSQGESEDQGDQDGDGSQGDQEGDQDGDQDDQEGGEPKIQFESGEGEDDEFDNPFADDLWPIIKPRIVEIAEDRAEQAYVQSARYSRLNGGSGSGSGERDVRVSGVKSGKVEGVTHHMFDKVLRAVARGCHVYLPGPPGTGKSHMALQVAEALGRDFSVTSFSPMSTESKLTGFRDANGNTVRTEYRERYEGGGIWLGDELDNANPAIVAGLNSGLANSFMEFPDGTIKRHDGFVCIATANTLGTGPTAEFSGRQKLDPATLNRFVKIFIGTDEAMETHLVEQILSPTEAERWLSKVRKVRRAVEQHRIKHFVTMRDSLQGARLIAPGDGKFTIGEALEMTVLAVLTDDQREKVRA